MKQDNEETAVVARDATEWQKKKSHKEIMGKLSLVGGYYSDEQDYDLYPVRQWHAKELPLEELKRIMERGDSTEIVYMIYRYGEMAKQRGYGAVLPPEIQQAIVIRNRTDEVDAYTGYQGFCEEAQEIILTSWSHEQVLKYVAHHGLAPVWQRKLLERGDKLEISTHIRCHGLDESLIIEMFDTVKNNGDYAFFYLFIESHELPVMGQRLMLQIVNPKAFSNYITCYGLWDDVHVDLFEYRQMPDICLYFERHHYLCPAGEDKLVRWENKEERHKMIMSYILHWKNANFLPSDHFLSALMKAPELDYEAISKVLLAMPYNNSFLYEGVTEDVELMSGGSEDAIMARFATGEPMHIRAVMELFFRNDPKLFESYLKQCTEKLCYCY